MRSDSRLGLPSQLLDRVKEEEISSDVEVLGESDGQLRPQAFAQAPVDALVMQGTPELADLAPAVQSQQLALVPLSAASPGGSQGSVPVAAHILASMSALDQERAAKRKADEATKKREAKAAKAAAKDGSQVAAARKAETQVARVAVAAAKAGRAKAGAKARPSVVAEGKAKAKVVPPKASLAKAAPPKAVPRKAAPPIAPPKAQPAKAKAARPEAPQQGGSKRAKTGVRLGVEDEGSRMQFRVRVAGAPSTSFKYTAQSKDEVRAKARAYFEAYVAEHEPEE